MSRPSGPNHTPWVALLFALLGLAWCGYVAFPTGNPDFCLSSGCTLFKDVRIRGISLWWVGGAYFFLLAILCLRGKIALAWNLGRFGLTADALLLIIMFFAAPCRDCLVVAALLGLSFCALRPAHHAWFSGHPGCPILLSFWFGLFLGNVILAATEAIPPYIIASRENRPVRIYFSPSCSACRDALLAYGKNAALYPVAERPGDMDAIQRLEALLAADVPMDAALRRSLVSTEPVPRHDPASRAFLYMRLLNNRVAVLKQGFTALPLIQINGMPRKTISSPPVSPPPAPKTLEMGGHTPRGPQIPVPESVDSELPWDTGTFASCSQNATAPCP